MRERRGKFREMERKKKDIQPVDRRGNSEFGLGRIGSGNDCMPFGLESFHLSKASFPSFNIDMSQM